HPGWLVGPELKNVLCVSGSELHRPSAHGLLEIGRVSVEPLDLILLERLVDRGLNSEGVNFPVILGVLGFLPYVQDEELAVTQPATDESSGVVPNGSVKADGYLVTRLDGVVVGVDVIPFGLGHPSVRGLSNLVEVEPAIGAVRSRPVIEDCLCETLNVSPCGVPILFCEGLLDLLLIPDVLNGNIAFEAVIEPEALGDHVRLMNDLGYRVFVGVICVGGANPSRSGLRRLLDVALEHLIEVRSTVGRDPVMLLVHDDESRAVTFVSAAGSRLRLDAS